MRAAASRTVRPFSISIFARFSFSAVTTALRPPFRPRTAAALRPDSIICWNYLYLAHQLEKAPDEETRENLRRTIAAHAPMAWAHINMLGEYDFSENKLRDALGILPLKSAA